MNGSHFFVPKCEHVRELPKKIRFEIYVVQFNFKAAAPRCQVIGCHRWDDENIFSKRRQNYSLDNLNLVVSRVTVKLFN